MHSSCLFPKREDGFSFLPAHRIIQTSQSHPSTGIREGTFFILKKRLPTVPSYSLSSWVQPLCGYVWHASSSSLECECMWLIHCCSFHLPRFRYCAFGHPPNRGAGIPPPPQRWIIGDENNSIPCYYHNVPCGFDFENNGCSCSSPLMN